MTQPLIPRLVIVAYRPKPGKEDVLLAEVRDHHPMLLSEGLATGREPVIMQAADGTVVEVFEWASPAAIKEAHSNPRVKAMWERFEDCCDYVPVGQLEEAGKLFSEFTPLEIEFPPMPNPPPSQREE
jgi:hypothetical protein